MHAPSLPGVWRQVRRLAVTALMLGAVARGATAGPVAAGNSFTVVAMPDQTVVSWGVNGSGQLGHGNTTPKAVPTAVPGLTGVVAVAAGASHSLALTSGGLLYAWGLNGNKQVGDGTTTTRTSPVLLGLTDVIAIAAGDAHSVALTADGSVWVWGYNAYGQLGTGNTTTVATPTQVVSLVSVTAIAAGGNHTLVRKSDGTVWVFGWNGNGQLGIGSTTNALSPTQMSAISGATAVAAGTTHSLVLLSDGTVKAAGYNNFCSLGDGTFTQRASPVTVTGLTGVASIAAGGYTSGAIKTDGTLRLWGLNGNGQVGDGTTSNRWNATTLAAPTGVSLLAVGANHTLAVTSTGVVYSWGSNSSSQLGDGTTTGRTTPDAISDVNYAWKVGTPTFNTSAGTYNVEKTVTISEATPGATIHYTLNGVDPTESDPVVASGGTVLIDESRTLKARAWNGAMPVSNLASAVYTLQVASPTFSPTPTTYTTPRTVSLSTTSPGATLRYTLDNSTPTAASTAYSAPFSVATTTTVRVIGFRSGWSNSTQNVGTYTMNFGTLPAPSPSPAAGGYTSSVTVTLTAMAGATIRYTTNGQPPNTSSPIYSAPLELLSTTTLKAIAYHPDYVTSPVTTAGYTIQIAAPTFSPTAGSYAPGQPITVSTLSAGATIRYTTNGLEPSATDPIIASGDTLPVGNYTLKASASRTGATTSATTTTAYSVNGAATPVRLAAGDSHSLAVRADGTPFGWGANVDGRVGDATTIPRPSPVVVNGLTGTTALAAGTSHSLGLRSDGRVFAWGYNGGGRLGDGTTTQRVAPTLVGTLNNAVAIAAGDSHSLALKADGTVVAWGVNSSGQLGDGTTTQRLSPVAVSGLSGIAAISAGMNHSLALTQTGDVYAWGSNSNGQLGDGTTTPRNVPTLVPGLTGVAAIRASFYFSIALKGDGTVVAWGYNGSGQLGDGTQTQRLAPVSVSSLSSVSAIDAGQSFGIALLANGTVMAWGANSLGQLGDGTTTPRYTPGPVTALPPVTHIASGMGHTLALQSDGSAWAWGRNVSGCLGDGTTTTRLVPEQIAGPGLLWRPSLPVLSDAAGTYSTERSVVVSHPDAAVVMRYTTNGSDPSEADPVVASGSTVAVTQSLTLQVAAWKVGAPRSAAASAAYELKAVLPSMTPGGGSFATPQTVTVATTTSGATIRYTEDGSDVTPAAAAYASPLAFDRPVLLRARAFRSGWTTSDLASATYWIAGGTTAAPVLNPAPGAYTDDVLVTAASASPDSAVRYTLDGSDPNENSPLLQYPIVLRATTTVRVRAFKYGYAASAITAGVYTLDVSGAVATPSISSTGGWFTTTQTVTVTGPAGATLRYSDNGADPTETDTSITSGSTLAVARSGVIKVRAFEPGLQPSAVRRVDFVITGALAAGDSHSMALKSDGTVWTWGDNSAGQIGDSLTPDRLTPVQVLSGAVAISAGGTRSLALKADGTVWAWGNNVRTPAQVATLTDIRAIAQAASHALALKANGTVWAWGANGSGQLGDGTQTPRTTPVQVVGLTGATAIAAGYNHSVALSSSGGANGRVWGWGSNSAFQLGDSTTTGNRLTPLLVPGLIGIRALSTGAGWTVAIESTGALRAWGDNSSGQLGNGATSSGGSPQPSPVSIIQSGAILAVGTYHSLLLDTDARLWAWGNANDGKLALSASGAMPFPQLAPVAGGIALAGGASHSLVSAAGGSIWAFGYGLDGQLGNNSTISAIAPVQVIGLTLADQSWLTGDPDYDGLTTWREYLRGLDPLSADTNRDGIPDGVDTPTAGNPQDPDVDHDGIANWREPALGTDPFNPDTDGDSHLDGADAFPLDPARWQLPPVVPGDTTPPVITLTEPRSARPIP